MKELVSGTLVMEDDDGLIYSGERGYILMTEIMCLAYEIR